MLELPLNVTQLIDTPDSLWDVLALERGADILEVHETYSRLEHPTSLQTLSWKVLSDPYYSHLYRKTGAFNALTRAGFFDDKLKEKWSNAPWGDLDWVCTPLNKILDNLPREDDSRPLMVLLSTGSFSPLHVGHISMMEQARSRFENEGWNVLGGYFSPSHDDYVSTKYDGTAALSIQHRLELCHIGLADHPWLMTDPWEAREAPAPLNFTDVIQRLSAYLHRHIDCGRPIAIAYVFGSDNAGFADAFVQSGYGICIAREPLTPSLQQQFQAIRNIAPPRVFAEEAPTASLRLSSTQARAGDLSQLPSAAQNLFKQWRNPRSAAPFDLAPYLVRDDLAWATRAWQLPAESHSWFLSELLNITHDAFANVAYPDVPKEMECLVLPLEEQQRHIDLLRQTHQTLGLDAGTTHTSSLRFSRQFHLADGQMFSDKLVASPGHPSVFEQLNRLKPGKFLLVDDDIASGQTIKTIQSLLPDNVEVVDILALAQWGYHQQRGDTSAFRCYDIVDARDFLLGCHESGLVVQLPDGEIARAPYMTPYVNLSTRAKIPPSSLSRMSVRLWDLNVHFFERWGSHLHVRDTALGTQRLLSYLGFNAETSLISICQWHAMRVRG